MKRKSKTECQLCGNEDYEFGRLKVYLLTTPFDGPTYEKGFSFNVDCKYICRKCGHIVGKALNIAAKEINEQAKANMKEPILKIN